jgi:hypothetical protein
MAGSIEIVGDDPLVDGMLISLRLRCDFLVTDASKVLAAGRRAFLDRHPEATAEDAELHVTCAADAVFELLDRAGMQCEFDADGLATRGSRAHLTFNDPNPAPYPATCFDGDLDVFALPLSAVADRPEV